MSAVLDADEEEEETEEQRYQRFFGPAESSTEDDASDEEEAPPAPPRLAIESEASALLARLIGEVLAEAKTRPERETARLACAAAGSFLAQIPGAAGAFEGEASREDVPQVMEDAIAMICRRLPITKIVAITISGYAARMIAARRPRQPILAVSNDAMAARSLNLLAGTQGIHVDIPFSRTSTDHIAQCMRELWERRYLEDDDMVLVNSLGYPRSGNRMNLLQTHNVSDLRETLDWPRKT